MIFLYSGTPGSGKSLHTARIVYQQLKKGLPVIVNFDINLSVIKNKKKREKLEENLYVVYNEDLTPQYLYDFSLWYFGDDRPVEGRITVIIDEAQVLFNTRDYARKDRKDWNKFFQIHRHYGFDIILAAQFDNMLDKQIRYVIEYEEKHRKVLNLGFKGFIVSLLTFAPFGCFICIKYWYPVKQKVHHYFFRYNKFYGSLYDTYNLNFSSKVAIDNQ